MSAKGARGAAVATGVDLVVVVVVVMVVCAVLVLVLVVVVVVVVVLCVVVFLALDVDTAELATDGAAEIDVTGLPSQGRTTRVTLMHSLFTSTTARVS
jgi:hypothetical protein